MEIKSCVFCKHFEHVNGDNCETCGYDAYDQCRIREKSKVYVLQNDQKANIVTAMKCPFFEWDEEIAKLREKGA